MKVHHNKLVRDLIPDIITASGKTPKTGTLNKEKHYIELCRKLGEEVQEFLEADNVEELADIMEVIDAILQHKGVNWDELRVVQREKREERGGFEQGIFLEWVEE